MRIAVDTNVLVRAAVQDDATQARISAKLLVEAELIAVTLPCLCEFVWVLTSVYKFSVLDVASAVRALASASNVQVNKLAVEAGLKVFEAGGDFADGIIAYEGLWLGADTFVSFDKKAVKLLSKQGVATRLL
jgi:predicted nucleic-acid-binding protein